MFKLLFLRLVLPHNRQSVLSQLIVIYSHIKTVVKMQYSQHCKIYWDYLTFATYIYIHPSIHHPYYYLEWFKKKGLRPINLVRIIHSDYLSKISMISEGLDVNI